MKRLVDGQDLAAPGVERCQLDGILIGFGAGVAEEEPVVVITRHAAESLCQLDLQRVHDRIGVKTEFSDLLRNGLHVVGLRVSDRDDGVSAVEVEVLGSGLVVDEAPLSPHGFDRIE